MENKEYFWVQYRNGDWVVAERRHLDRWFICGVGHIVSVARLEQYRVKKNPYDLVRIGSKIECQHLKEI